MSMAVITRRGLTSPSKATDYEDENLYLGTPNGMRLFEVTDEDLMSNLLSVIILCSINRLLTDNRLLVSF